MAILQMLVLAVLVASGQCDFNLTILHTNDVHARIEESNKYAGPCTAKDSAKGKCFGGVARIRTMVDEKRKEFPDHVILLDAGDQFQGTLWYYEFGGLVTAEFMNLVGYDAMAIGNHEFDGGIDGLAPFAHNLTFPLLSSNINFQNTPKLRTVVDKSVVLTVAGERIGVVGYTTTETPYISRTETATFTGELAAVQTEIDKLTAQGVNKIIALGHSGYSMDITLGKHLRDVDVIVGGHTNTFLYTGNDLPSNESPSGNYPTIVNSENVNQEPVLVVQDYAFGKYLGELHVTFDDNGKVTHFSGNPILLDKSVAKDNETMDRIRGYIPRIEALKQEVVGVSNVELMANRVQCRTTECNLGNLVTDALITQNVRPTNTSWSEVAIAMANAGSFRASIDRGEITVEEVIFVQPFRNTIDIVELKGQTILDMLEYCGQMWSLNSDSAFGGFLQVSGLKIIYDIERPVNKRVVDVQVLCTECLVPEYEPLDAQKTYKVLLNSYIANGGDGFSMLPDAIIRTIALNTLDLDNLLDYIKSRSPIIVGIEGRIRHYQDVITEHQRFSGQACDGTAVAPSTGLFWVLLLSTLLTVVSL